MFATAAGYPTVPNGLLFGGGFTALHQLGLEMFAIIVVGIFVFTISFIASALISKGMHGILAVEGRKKNEESISSKVSAAR